MERFWPEYLQAKYLELKHLWPFRHEFIQAKPAISLDFSTILFTFVRSFWIGFIQDKIALTLLPITANYRTVNGKPLAWIFSSQILEIEAPFAVLP
jgi:hypothetical protein